MDLGIPPLDEEKKTEEEKVTEDSKPLSAEDSMALCEWLKISLGSQKVRDVKTTTRLGDSPALITDHESGSLRRMLKMLVG